MSRLRDVVAVGLLLSGSWSVQASELLSTYQYDPGAGFSWAVHVVTGVKFYLDDGAALGADESPYWHEGESGVFDFQPNVTNWTTFTSCATNGVDDEIRMWVYLERPTGGHSWGYRGRPESQFFNRPTDLIGCNIETVRLIVNDVHMWTEEDRFYVSADATWEFWGTVPEPCTIVLLGSAVLLGRRRRY